MWVAMAEAKSVGSWLTSPTQPQLAHILKKQHHLPGLPKAMLAAMDDAKSVGSWLTSPSCARRKRNCMRRMSTPSSSTCGAVWMCGVGWGVVWCGEAWMRGL